MDNLTKTRIETKIAMLKQRLEGVMKTTKDPVQRKRVSIDLARLDKDHKRLQEGSFDIDDEDRYLTEKDRELVAAGMEHEVVGLETFSELGRVEISQAHPYCNERDINEIFSFLRHLEDEFWGALSDYQLKLDFNLSHKRDKMLNNFGMLQIAFKNYFDILKDLTNQHTSSEFLGRLKNMRTKQHMDLLLKTGDFFKEVRDLLEIMLNDYRDGGTAIVNPEHELRFDEVHGERELHGVNIIVALQRLQQFVSELLAYMNLPEFGKYRNDSL